MAGSSLHPSSPDNSLMARIEGLKLLAHHIDEPVVVFNPQMQLVYANPAADQIAEDCPLLPSNGQASTSSGSPSTPQCESCPGQEVFQKRNSLQQDSQSRPSPQLSSSACPLPRAMALTNDEGQPHFAVMMGATARKSVVLSSSDSSPVPSGQLHSQEVILGSSNGIIGESGVIHRLVELMKLVAASEASALIQGESGTGKELVAQTIHRWSRRRNRPFIVVECSSLPETLLESELFGHVRGAFTGAVSDRKGLFEEAEGGTIFLDEIADTSPAFQARLLRVLQEGEIKPVGSNQPIRVNVRVISAGNQPIEALVKNKSFRADLFYRLAVLPLMIPPLRDRVEDIPLLVEHFLSLAAKRNHTPPITLNSETMQAFKTYSWPGNVRELENLIERLVVTGSHTSIRWKEYFEKSPEGPQEKELRMIGKQARQKAEREKILQALSDTHGDKTRAARLLKISRSSLYNKLREYQIL